MSVIDQGVVTILPEAIYEAGSYVTPEFSVDDTSDGVVLQIPRCTAKDRTVWSDPSVEIFVRAEASYDGGPWLPAGGFGAHGGVHVRALDGLKKEAVASSCPINLPPGVNRKLRVTVMFSGAAKTACGKSTFKRVSGAKRV